MANTHSLDLELDSSQLASITDASQTGLDPTGDMTVEGWFKLESISGGIHAIRKDDGSATTGYILYFETPDRFGFFMGDGTNTSQAAKYGVISTGQWYHVAATYNSTSGQIELYLNGEKQTGLDTDTTNATGGNNNTDPFTISVISNRYDGLVNEVRVWSDIRTASEIADNAGVELTGSEGNLVGYWKLNNDYTDETSNGNDLTASGSPVFSTNIPWENPTGVSGSTYLETSLSGFWDFTDGTGSTITDDTGGTNASMTGGSWVTSNGPTGSPDGVDFDGSTDNAIAATNYNIPEGSLSVWFYSDASTGATQAIVGNGNLGGSGEGDIFIVDGPTDLYGRIRFTGDVNSIYTGFGYATLYHAVYTWSDTNKITEFYVNGVLIQKTTGISGSVSNGTGNFTFAERSGLTGANFDGKIYQTGLYGRVLHYGDILDLYSQGSGIPYTFIAPVSTQNALSMSNF